MMWLVRYFKHSYIFNRNTKKGFRAEFAVGWGRHWFRNVCKVGGLGRGGENKFCFNVVSHSPYTNNDKPKHFFWTQLIPQMSRRKKVVLWRSKVILNSRVYHFADKYFFQISIWVMTLTSRSELKEQTFISIDYLFFTGESRRRRSKTNNGVRFLHLSLYTGVADNDRINNRRFPTQTNRTGKMAGSF